MSEASDRAIIDDVVGLIEAGKISRDVVIGMIERAGGVIISQATADAIDAIARRLDAGIAVPSSEIDDVLYAAYSCLPDHLLPKPRELDPPELVDA